MTAGIPETYGNAGPWQRYVAKERAAREAYLAVTHRAQQEYLSGPWPDREAYDHVERSAWITYYAAGRDAWRHYTAEITPPPPPPAQHPAQSPGAAQSGQDQMSQRYWAAQPSFTEREGSDGQWRSS